MPEATDKKGLFLQNLIDAGCDDETIRQCMDLAAIKNYEETRKKLKQHKQRLLDRIHTSQKEIDCLDYLLYSMEKQCGEGDFLL